MAVHYFQANYDSLRPDIDALITATKAVLDSKSLKTFLRFTLQTGNFINAVCMQNFCNTNIWSPCSNIIMSMETWRSYCEDKLRTHTCVELPR